MGVKFDCANKIPLTEGGEGIIYEHNGQIVKIYKPAVDLKSKKNKVQILMNKDLPKEVICPTNIVMDRSGNFIGFIMNKVEGEELKKLTNKKFVTANRISTKDILSMLVKAQEVIAELHKNDIYIGDLNDQNILFDKHFNIYFIDCDSWAVGNEKCEVAMDLFKDPLLKANDFSAKTDTYSFSILAWKLLTRIHPFGGTMSPDISITERMRKGISVIDNPKVVIPRTIKGWRNLSPALIETLKSIFETDCRVLHNELSDMLNNIKFCDNDREYYYGKYSTCPLCDSSAKIQSKPISQGVMSGLKLFSILDASRITTVLSEKSYLDTSGNIIDIRSNRSVKCKYGTKYYFTLDGYMIEDFTDKFVINSEKIYTIEKKYKSQIIVEDNHIYYISPQNTFVDMNILKQGNSIKNICKCSNNTYFEVKDGNYCIANFYFGKIIVNINGKNLEMMYESDIINYGIHYDIQTGRWLIVLENSKGQFNTFIIKNGELDYETDQIRYACQLSSLCVSNGTVFIPVDGKIRGFSYQKCAFKDFECGVVNIESKLIKKKDKFVIVNDENIYSFG